VCFEERQQILKRQQRGLASANISNL